MMAISEPIIPILESKDLAIIEAASSGVELECDDPGLSHDLRQVHNFQIARHTTPPR